MSVYDTQDAVRTWERIDLDKWEHVKPADCDKLRPRYSAEWVCDTCLRQSRRVTPIRTQKGYGAGRLRQ